MPEVPFRHIYIGDPAEARQRLDVYGRNDVLEIAASIRAELKEAFDAIPAYVPIGCCIPWMKSLAGVPQTLPVNFAECNGEIIHDKGSPLYGGRTPNLNGENRYLRGNSTSGGVSGAETHAHALSAVSTGSFDTNFDGSSASAFIPNGDSTDPADGRPPSYDTVWIMRIK